MQQIILITGPQGCGKTTELNKIARELNYGEFILTTDPIKANGALSHCTKSTKLILVDNVPDENQLSILLELAVSPIQVKSPGMAITSILPSWCLAYQGVVPDYILQMLVAKSISVDEKRMGNLLAICFNLSAPDPTQAEKRADFLKRAEQTRAIQNLHQRLIQKHFGKVDSHFMLKLASYAEEYAQAITKPDQQPVTEQQLIEMGFKQEDAFNHDQYHTKRYNLGPIRVYFAFYKQTLVNIDMEIDEMDSITPTYNLISQLINALPIA